MDDSSKNLRSIRALLDELSAAPGTKDLGDRLSEVLDVTRGVTKDEAKNSERVDREWGAAKRKHLFAKVMENAVNDVVGDYEIRIAEEETEQTIDTEERQHMEKFLDRFSKAELEDFLHLPMGVADNAVAVNAVDAPAPTLLSLTPVDVRPGPLPASTRAYVTEKVEERLFGVCEGLLRQLEGGHAAAEGRERSLKERYGRVNLLPEMVHTEKASVEQNRQATRASEEALREDWKHIDVVVKSFEQLETLAMKHRMRDKTKIDMTNAKYLALKCKTLAFKARCLELEILASTYKPEAVQALKKIKVYLDKTLATVCTEVERSKASLMQYEAVGEEFDAVVSEYARLKAEIEGKEWAIKELKDDSQI